MYTAREFNKGTNHNIEKGKNPSKVWQSSNNYEEHKPKMHSYKNK